MLLVLKVLNTCCANRRVSIDLAMDSRIKIVHDRVNGRVSVDLAILFLSAKSCMGE